MCVGVVSFTARLPMPAPTVGSIIVQGNQRVEADTIRSYFRPGPGGQLDAFQIDEGVKTLISTGLFQDVRPTIQGGRLIITVTENPVINRIAFEGNKKVKDDQLQSEIQSKERGTLLVPWCRRHGAHGRGLPPQRPFRHARRTEDHRASEQPRRSRLRNHEGVKTGVKQINFVGNRAYSSYRLKDVIKTSTTGLLAFLQTGDIYDPDRIEADRELLRRFYLKHGFIDVRIVSRVRNTIRTAAVS
jgi:outer membrane protein insertion porin family